MAEATGAIPEAAPAKELPIKEESRNCGTADDVPPKEDVGWRRIVRNFTPSWFAVIMGTGIVSILLHNLPYNASWVRYISVAIFILNVALFTVFSLITLTRYILYPEIWEVMIKHPSQSLFLGCIPMGLATIINMIIFEFANGPWGYWAVRLAWGLWWVDVAGAAACCLTVPFVAAHHHRSQLQQVTAALLLPVVPAVVASASGGVIAAALLEQGGGGVHDAAITVVASYVLWGLGQAFSLLVTAVYFLRLQVHDLPPREAIVSVFLPVGPLGQGGFAIQQLGKVARDLLPPAGAVTEVGTGVAAGAGAGEVVYVLGIFVALCMWGAALGWLAFALISILSTKSFPFNMGWWGFTFPLGTFATCTGLLATELSSTFFKVLTMIFSLSVTLLWIVVATKTVQLAVTGEMFYAPCLKDLRPKSQQGGGNRTV